MLPNDILLAIFIYTLTVNFLLVWVSCKYFDGVNKDHKWKNENILTNKDTIIRIIQTWQNNTKDKRITFKTKIKVTDHVKS